MARKARRKSSTDYYHVVMRGNNKTQIFALNEQKNFLLRDLKIHEDSGELSIVAWCIMSNHIHIVLVASFEDLIQSFHRINTRFAMRQHWLQKTSGHVFQGRFWSEPIESDDYLIRAVRYVHNNPVKASLVSDAAEWEWSSYSQYQHGEYNNPMQFVYQLIGGTWARFTGFHDESDLMFRPLDTRPDQLLIRDQYTQAVLNEVCLKHGILEWKNDRVSTYAMQDAAMWLAGENDFSFREVARRLGITHNTVRSYVDLMHTDH